MDTLRFWTDSGPRYKSYECLGSRGIHVPEYFGVSSHVYYGPPAHWKGECDGKFSHMNAATRAAAMEDDINDIPDLVHVFKEHCIPAEIE